MAQKRKPVTVEEIELFLDLVARLMAGAGRDAELYLPIWRALKRELYARQEVVSIFAEARARLERTSGRPAIAPSTST
ncbi:MAG: hypothetical protein WBA88_17215 [Pseudaminobacter sp.]